MAFFYLICWIAYQRFGIPNATEPVTIDAFSSTKDLIKTITYGCLYFAIVCLVNTPRRVLVLIYGVLLAALTQSMIGSIHTLQGLQPTARGTFPNPNHFAGYLEMSLGLGTGLMIAMQDLDHRVGREKIIGWLETITGPKTRLRLILLTLVIGLVMSASRMGNIAFFSSILIGATCYIFFTGRVNKMTVIFLASVLIIDVAIVGKYFGIERVSQRLQTMTLETETRDDINKYSWQIFTDHPIAGTGAGTYELIFTRYRGPEIQEHVTNAENDYLEFLVELGVIGSVPLMLIVLVAVSTQIRVMKHPSQFTRGIALGCFMGTVALLIHSAADFNLQIPSNAVLFIVLLALPQALEHHNIA